MLGVVSIEYLFLLSADSLSQCFSLACGKIVFLLATYFLTHHSDTLTVHVLNQTLQLLAGSY